MKQRIINAALRTWDNIGSDCLNCLSEQGEEPVMPQDHVIETVADADYMNIYGGDKDAYEEFKKLSWEEKEEILRDAFPFKTYGW
jgi:hypothetical protein